MTDKAKDLLEEWCTWLFEQPYQASPPVDVNSDPDGSICMRKNQGRNVWFLSGTWAHAQTTPRIVDIPYGTPMFVVVASAHATTEELEKTHTPKTTEALEKRADDIAKLWTDVKLTVNGQEYKKEELLEVNTDVCNLYIEPSSYYNYKWRRDPKSNLTSMVTKAYVYLIESSGPIGTEHNLKLYAYGDKDAAIGEPQEYIMSVEYKITIV